MSTIDIGKCRIGSGHPCFIIAEAGVNHNGDIAIAHRLIDAAAAANATAVKFQTFRAEKLVSQDAPKADYQIRNTEAHESQYEMLRKLELPPEAHLELIRYCQSKDILFLSTPFDEESADLLERIGVLAFKIPSGEITNLPFIEHLARKHRPVLLSTGMSDLLEVETAVKAIRSQGNQQIVLLQCVSNYPAEPADANLRAMATMHAACGALVGYSDHTQGMEVSVAAVALGACVVEKHFTLDRNLPGPDHKASLEPDELRLFVQSIRRVESAMGNGSKQPAESERNTRQVARKSLTAARDLSAGTMLDATMIALRRPGTGLPPAHRDKLVGRIVKTDVSAGTLLTWEMLA